MGGKFSRGEIAELIRHYEKQARAIQDDPARTKRYGKNINDALKKLRRM